MSTRFIKKLFKYDQIKNVSICIECKYEMKGKHSANLGRHIQRKHPELHNEIKNKLIISKSNHVINDIVESRDKPLDKYTNIIRIKMTQKDFIDSCVKLVTVDGRPFSIFDDSGMREIINPIMSALKTPINSHNIVNFIDNKALNIRDNIKTEISNKMISVKVDSAYRLGRSILGINIQYIFEGTIKLRTLDMYETTSSQTGVYLKNIIIDVLKSYDIELEQVYSITSDNGKNMVKAAELLKSEYEYSNGEDDYEENQTFSQFDFEKDTVETLVEMHPNIIHFRCVAHSV